MAGSGVLTIFVYKGLTRSPEIGNKPLCPISGDWGELRVPNLARMSLIKSYCLLQSARFTTRTVSEFSRKKQQGVKLPPTYSQIKVNLMIY